MKKTLLLIVTLLQFSFLFSQTKIEKAKTITIGVRFQVENGAIKKDSIEFNLYHKFEYDFLEMFNTYVQKHKKDLFNIRYRQISQSEKLKYLNPYHEDRVDAIVYAVSITDDRIKNGLRFSSPYFSNKSIILATNSSKTTFFDFKKDKILIGYIENSTSGNEVKLLASKNKNINKRDFDNFKEMHEALQKGEIDAIAGDRSLLASYFLDNELYFAGNLPTKSSKIEDQYGIVFHKNNKNIKEIRNLFNGFIKTNYNQITELKNKYFSNVEDELLQYYSKDSFSINTVIYSLIGILLVFLLTIWYFLTRLKKSQKENESILKRHYVDDTKEQLSNILESAFSKFRDKLETDEIAQIGIDFFNTATERITYIGSGGFMSNDKYGESWKKAIHGALKRNVIIDRIVDLPLIDFNKLEFEHMAYFHPESYDRKYVSKYLKWLLLQYIDLVNFGENFKIHNSRGASLWGYGLAILIKDDSEVLLFTTKKDKKIGSVIVNHELAVHFADLMDTIKNLGKEIDEFDIEKEFFSTENNLTTLIHKLKDNKQKNSRIIITDKINKDINDISKEISNRFFKKHSKDK